MQTINFNNLSLAEAKKVLAGDFGGTVTVDLAITIQGHPRPARGPYKTTVELDGKTYLKMGEAARIIGINRTTLEKHTLRGHINCVTTEGGHRLYEVEEVERFRESRQQDMVLVVR